MVARKATKDWMSDRSKRVGESAKRFPTWQGISWRVRGDLRRAGGPVLWMRSDTSRRHPTSHNLKTLWERRAGEKQEGANELLLRDEQGGGRKQKRHVPHHLFAQRLYSTLHSCLASLANFKLWQCNIYLIFLSYLW